MFDIENIISMLSLEKMKGGEFTLYSSDDGLHVHIWQNGQFSASKIYYDAPSRFLSFEEFIEVLNKEDLKHVMFNFGTLKEFYHNV